MPKILSDLYYTFLVDSIWTILKYIVPILFISGGYLMNGWMAATLLGFGSFFTIAYIKYLFDESNKIEGKLLILDQFLITPTVDQNLNICLYLHNCSNQIIDIEIDAQNTKGSVQTSTHDNFLTNLRATIPPYIRAELRFPAISVASLANQKELTLDITVTAKYGHYTKDRMLEIKKHLTTKFLKNIDEKGQITYTPKS